jgi:hypothetical protein
MLYLLVDIYYAQLLRPKLFHVAWSKRTKHLAKVFDLQSAITVLEAVP